MDVLLIAIHDPAAWASAALLAASLAALVAVRPRAALRCARRSRACLSSPGGARELGLSVEVAASAREQRVGLMFRRQVADGTGMLFRWRRPGRSFVWMRNTLVPLDLVFLDESGAVLRIVNREPRGWAISGAGFRSASLLELPGGYCARNGVSAGWRFALGGKAGAA